MAWVRQSFHSHGFSVDLRESSVSLEMPLGSKLVIEPLKQEQAHSWAMMLRRAARRLEEMGKGLV